MDSNQLIHTMKELLKKNGSSLSAEDQQLAWVIATTSPDPLAMLSCKMRKNGDEIIFEKPETPKPSISQSTDPIVISFSHSISEQEQKLNINKPKSQKPLEEQIDQLTSTIENLQKTLSRFDLDKLADLSQRDHVEKRKIDNMISQQVRMRRDMFDINVEMERQTKIYTKDRMKWLKERAQLEKELQHYKSLSEKITTVDSSNQTTQAPAEPSVDDSELLNLVENLRKQYKCVNCNQSLHEAGPKDTQQSNSKVEVTVKNVQDSLHITEPNKLPLIPTSSYSQMQIQSSTQTNRSIDGNKRAEFRLKFQSLMEIHRCNSPNCTVAKFKDEVIHARTCNVNPNCSHYICELLQKLVKHLKNCKNQAECLTCQPYVHFDEQKLYRMMVVLEEGCGLTSDSPYDMTTAMRESILMITARHAVNYGLLDDLEDNIDSQPPGVIAPSKENNQPENEKCVSAELKKPIEIEIEKPYETLVAQIYNITAADLEETAKALQNTLHISEQNEPSAEPELEVQIPKTTTVDETTVQLQQSFMQLLVNHSCQDSECCVIAFKGYIEHAGVCNKDSECNWFICKCIHDKLEHQKFCVGEADCTICQCYGNMKEVKIIRMMDILEQGCSFNAKFNSSMTAAMKETITTMVARLAVNSFLVDRNSKFLAAGLTPQVENKTVCKLDDSLTDLPDSIVKILDTEIPSQVEDKTDSQTTDASSDTLSLSGDWEYLDAERRLEVD